MEEVNFYLVVVSIDDRKVLEICEKQINGDLASQHRSVNWLTGDECLGLDLDDLKKNDIFIFKEFKGAAFEHIRRAKNKSLILGPPAVTYSFTHDEPFPSESSCIYNAAMYGLVVAFTGEKDPIKKAHYAERVSQMGGFCWPEGHMPERCTHLIANLVLSTKYELAVERGIAIMNESWVDEVWRRNAIGMDFVAASDPVFDCHKLPIFYNLRVASTSLDTKERNKIEELITSNGGVYNRKFQSKSLDILVLNEAGKNSDKYRAAIRTKVLCLTTQWVYDSVEKGYAVSLNEYRLSEEVKVSTPNRNTPTNPDFSVSHIHGPGNVSVNESTSSTRSNQQPVFMDNEADVPEDNYYKEALKNLSATNAKKAGCFLDGCNIYFSGFTQTELNKLNKIVSLSGATRFDEIHDNVTHVIIGRKVDKELNRFKEANGLHLLKFDWLMESMKLKQPAVEDEYLFYAVANVAMNSSQAEPPSPLSKKNIAAMNSSFKKPLPINGDVAGPSRASSVEPLRDEMRRPRSDLMQKYLQSTSVNMDPVAKATSMSVDKRRTNKSAREQSRLMHSTFDSDLDTDEFENLTFFAGKRFAVQQCEDRDEYQQMLVDIQNFGGQLVDKATFKGTVDYLVTPAQGLRDFKPEVEAIHIVSNLWIEDVINARNEVPVQYYHRAISVNGSDVMRGICCTVSTYAGTERIYLTLVCESMGATVEEKYAKNSFPVLICEAATGSKYKGAINWEYPVVTKDWVLDSYNQGHLYKLEDYLVGLSVLSKKHKHFSEINDRGIHRGTEPPQASQDDILILSDSTQGSQMVPASGTVAIPLKRKSDDMLPHLMDNDNGRGGNEAEEDDDCFVFGLRNSEKRFKSNSRGQLYGTDRSPTKNHRVMALRSESKSTSSPTTPISEHLREMDFGYDTPQRKQLYDVLKETAGKTPHTPHTPPVMRMPSTPLHPNPEASPNSQWNVIHKFSGFLEKNKKKQTKRKTAAQAQKVATPLSEIKRRFWKNAIGEENYNSTLMLLNSQALEINQNDRNESNVSQDCLNDSTTSNNATLMTPDNAAALQGLSDLINKNRKSEPRKLMANIETCPADTPEIEIREPEIMVGWAEADNVPRSSIAEAPYMLTSGIVWNEPLLRMVKSLNANIRTDQHNYDNSCTHVICSKLGRMEKVMCAMVAGKWILTAKYITDSAEAKKLLNEELYQWGNPKATKNLPEMTALEQSLAKAAYSWRQKITDPANFSCQKGAFQGFRILLSSTRVGFERIIEAGGGVLLKVSSVYSKSEGVAKTATHCLVDKKEPFPRENYDFCKAHSIPVYDVQFLSAYVMDESAEKIKELDFKA